MKKHGFFTTFLAIFEDSVHAAQDALSVAIQKPAAVSLHSAIEHRHDAAACIR